MTQALYWCLLDEQPHHLVAPAAIAAQPTGGLVLDPDCRFSWRGQHHADALDQVASFLPASCVAWVPDACTGATWPYWVGYRSLDSLVALSTGAAVEALAPDLRWVLAQAGILARAGTIAARRREAARRAAWIRQQMRRGFAVLEALVPPFHIAAMRRYYRQCVRAGVMHLGDGQVDRRYVAHNEPVARFVQRQLTRMVSAVVGHEVKPSYAYVAAYQGGAALERHTDRSQCQYTLSICIDNVPETSGPCPWSLNLDIDGRTLCVMQRLGAGLLFRGRRIVHHRDRLAANASVTTLLLHYVDADFAGGLD